jgi:hypothetical protein
MLGEDAAHFWGINYDFHILPRSAYFYPPRPKKGVRFKKKTMHRIRTRIIPWGSNLFAHLHTYIETVRKKDGAQGEISSLRPPPGADHIRGIVCAFHTLLPPKVIVNITETRENELRGAEAGIWSSGGRMPHPVEKLRQRNYSTPYCEDSQKSRYARSFINYIIRGS